MASTSNTSQSCRWCFTLNNPTENDRRMLQQYWDSDDLKYLIYGKETGESGTPHLQGYLVLKSRIRFRTLKRLLGGRVHLELARGTHLQASDYCKKDGEFCEFGILPSDSEGNRRSFEYFVEWAKEFYEDTGIAPGERAIAQRFPGLFVRYPRSLLSLVEHNLPLPSFETGNLLPWQQELWNYLDNDPDDRTIRFIVDEEGGKGKSWFARYLYTKKQHDVQLLSVGKRDDIAHAIDATKKFFVFNVPRGGMEFLQYTILEQLKDRVVFSPKYASRTKMLGAIPHVVVMCNEQPDLTKMTADRYDIIDTFN